VELIDFLRGVSGGGGGAVNEDVAFIVPVALSANTDDNGGGVPWTFSTFDLDRYDERIDPAGWDLAHYRKNPVVQWAHRFDIPAIGRAAGLLADDGGLHGNIIFNDKEFDAFGWGIGERVRRGVLCAGSVGFRILEIELPSKEEEAAGTSLIFRKQELLEFSICNVPANPFALQGSRERLAGSKEKNVRLDFWGGLVPALGGGLSAVM
jgi:HK97 family phage prohead protease